MRAGRYIEFVKNTFPAGCGLDGLKIVVDCANGAAYKVAPEVLWELGADVVALGVATERAFYQQGLRLRTPATMLPHGLRAWRRSSASRWMATPTAC